MKSNRIAVIGTRGFPGIQGGVETHCENLCPRLAQRGFEMIVMRRKHYVPADTPAYSGVRFIDLGAPRAKAIEALIHSVIGVFRARFEGARAVHIHAVGPALVTPIARMLGMRVIATNHGPDYCRAKWGRFAKAALRLGECFQARWANEVISIAQPISDTLLDKYNRDSTLIFNGVESPAPQDEEKTAAHLREMGLEAKRYVLALGRFVPEKNFHLLVEAFKEAPEGFKLVIAGSADHADAYSETLIRNAKEAGVVLPGFIKGEQLDALLRGAALFVLPSSHEGLPISLLEAMSHSLEIAVSDIPANRLPQLQADDYFEVDSVAALSRMLQKKLSAPILPRNYDMSPFDWDSIADATAEVYRKALK